MILRNLENEQKNANHFGLLPPELITQDGVSKYLSISQMKTWQCVSLFFYHHTALRNHIQKKSDELEMIGKGSWLFFKSGDGLVYNCQTIPALALPIQLTPLRFDKPIDRIVMGENHAFLCDEAGEWYLCGYNFEGQCGIGQFNSANPMTKFNFADGKPVIDIVTGYNTSFICNSEGKWYACGENTKGQLGIQTTENQAILTRVMLPNGLAIKKIAAGFTCTFFQDENGQWFGCGSNHDGKLNIPNPSTQFYSTPLPITLANQLPIIDIVAGYTHNFLLDQEGNWHGVGKNAYGELGDKDKINGSIMTLPNKKRIKHIQANYSNSFFCDEDNEWHACGFNAKGELGCQTQDKYVSEPQAIFLENKEPIIKIHSSNHYTFFLDAKNQWHVAGGTIGFNKIIPLNLNLIKPQNKSEQTHKIK